MIYSGAVFGGFRTLGEFSMSEVFVEGQSCGACGAEIRPDTQYCYSCGSLIGPVAIERFDAIERPVGLGGKTPEGIHEAGRPIQMPADALNGTSNAVSPTEVEQALATSVADEPDLRPASALRRQARDRKPVEIVWKSADIGPNVIFIVASAVLLIFAAVIVVLALYYR